MNLSAVPDATAEGLLKECCTPSVPLRLSIPIVAEPPVVMFASPPVKLQ